MCDDSLERRAEEDREMDEEATRLANHLPLHWKSFFDNLVVQGFAEQDAFVLLKLYITVSLNDNPVQYYFGE